MLDGLTRGSRVRLAIGRAIDPGAYWLPRAWMKLVPKANKHATVSVHASTTRDAASISLSVEVHQAREDAGPCARRSAARVTPLLWGVGVASGRYFRVFVGRERPQWNHEWNTPRAAAQAPARGPNSPSDAPSDAPRHMMYFGKLQRKAGVYSCTLAGGPPREARAKVRV